MGWINVVSGEKMILIISLKVCVGEIIYGRMKLVCCVIELLILDYILFGGV